ncbi:MAG: hypothetical protein UW71_C0020G0010 [Parcubacteria group bacterium GW2011_GWB1_44_7]|nr:MAG: hypothetical protein UW71_C0020G0010 [Parcubacteria group bacterium GW2011_GWB1_44_7]
MNTELEAKLSGYIGCLSHKKITSARRRFGSEADEDLLIPGVDPFLIDAELKIASSKAIRRMLDKTQVLTAPHNLHVRKRITHCGEVTSTATFIASILGLNVECVRAIALGHDMGHPPFGHDGEAFLNSLNPAKPFKHEVMGVVIGQHIERFGRGLNLTHEVLSGIVRDAWPVGTERPMSEEAKVVMWADRFAYVTGDYNDMIRIGYPMGGDLEALMSVLGENQRARINRLVVALVGESAVAGCVSFEKSQTASSFFQVKELLYKIYPTLNASNAAHILAKIYDFIGKAVVGVDPAVVLALMTDQDAVFLANEPVLDYSRFAQTTVAEILPPLVVGKEICWWDPDLKW